MTETTEIIHPESAEGEELIEGADEGDLSVDARATPIRLEKNDRSLHELHRWYRDGRLIVDPDWQRRYVWDRKRASRLIESFLVELPIPVIYLGVNEKNNYEVIDGLQRLTSVFDFFDKKFALTGLEIRPDLNGAHFPDLSKDIKSKLEDTTIRTFELANTTPKDLMFVIFQRLNTGGVPLNDMEIRNCLYRGKLNELIKNLADLDEFKLSVSQAGLDRRMQDRALVLRFLAFYQMTYTKARKGLKAFFNEFFSTYRDAPDPKLKEFESVFKKCVKAGYTVFGEKGFRLRREPKQGGEWTPRVNAAIFQVLTVSFAHYDLGQLTRAADRIFEAYCDLISTDKNWVDAVTKTTGSYPKIEYSFEEWNKRLKEALADFEPNDKLRLFTRQLKQEMYGQDDTCKLCGQRIALINDAALDHDKHYWKGGKTVPSNARLVHRQCNLERPRS